MTTKLEIIEKFPLHKLKLDSTAAAVREILGEPNKQNATQWIYHGTTSKLVCTFSTGKLIKASKQEL